MDLESAGDIDVFPGNSVIVIHPGSLHLRVGKASDSFPHTLPHCIAWRKARQGIPGSLQSWLPRATAVDQEQNDKQRKAAVKKAQEALCTRPTSMGDTRTPTSYKELSRLNSHMKPEKSDVVSPLQWCNIDQEPQFVIGEDALYLHPSSSYDLHWPYRYGDLNIKCCTGQTPTAVMRDLEAIWSTAIETFLDIKRKDFERFKVILLVPDIFKRRNVRMLVDLVLNELGFSAIVVMQESVCASYGAALSSACVVDVGDQKISISCVEDGISVKESRIVLNYGGRDLTHCFHWLLQRIGYPHDCSDASASDRPLTALLLQELKHTYCHMNQDEAGIDDLFLQLRPPGQAIIKYAMKVGDERLLAPLAVFYPDMLSIRDATSGDDLLLTRLTEPEPSDPSDPFDDSYVAQTRMRGDESTKSVGGRKKGAGAQLNESVDLGEGEGGQTQADEDMLDAYEEVGGGGGRTTPATTNATQSEDVTVASGGGPASEASRDDRRERLSKDTPMPLDLAILYSIDQCDSDDLKMRMYSNILVAGGGLMFDGAAEWLQYRLLALMPAHYRIRLESMDVTTRPKDLDPQIVCWKGGAITSVLGTTQEMWIKTSEWQCHGAKVLRERGTFTW